MARKLLGFTVLAMVAGGAYVSAPVVAAWQIREAVRSGNTGVLEEKVDWPSVRKSLKASLGASRKVLGELTDAAGLPRPGIWQRLKMAAMPFLSDPLIDRYVTSEGAPKLYVWRKRIQSVRDAAHAPTELVVASATRGSEGWLDRFGIGRIMDASERVREWGFVSPMRFEVKLEDRLAKQRTWHAALEMQGFAWKLTELRVAEDAPSPLKTAANTIARAR